MAVPYLLSFGWGQRYKIKNKSHKKWYKNTSHRKWHNSTLLHSEILESPSLRRLYRAAETAWMDTRLARSMHPYDKPQPLPPLFPKGKREGGDKWDELKRAFHSKMTTF
jgi:hypothetical protein